MKTVVVSDDNVVYVSTNVAQALGPMLESIVSSMKPGSVVRRPFQAGLRDSLGEQLADTSSKNGFWIPFSQGGPQISPPGIRHPLDQDETALKETLTKQVRLGNIRVVSRAEDQNLILPESPLTPALGALSEFEAAREIETDKIYTLMPPPDPGNGSGFFVLSHQNMEGRTSNFASNIEEGVKALGNRELTSLGNFSTATDLAPDFHLSLYAAGAVDWFALRLKEFPRRRQDVM